MENHPPEPPPETANVIQADATAFKSLVQKLTGAACHSLRPKASPFKLHQRRRHCIRNIEAAVGGVKKPIPLPSLGTAAAVGDESPASDVVEEMAEKAERPAVLLILFPLTPLN